MILVRVAVFALLFCGVPLSVLSAATRLAIGYSTINPRVTPLWIAQEKGFFQNTASRRHSCSSVILRC